MRKIFNDKYAALILKKNIAVGPICNTEKETLYGLERNNIIKEGNTILFHDLMGNVVYKGTDYIYRRFSIRAFFHIKYLNRMDRKMETLKGR
jgi:hypothetical protein